MTIEKAIAEAIGKKPMALNDYAELWLQWYKGNVAEFHNYNIYNGKKTITCERKTLNMAKKICEDWANLLLNEKTDISFGNDEQHENAQKLLNKVNFWVKGNEGVEKTFGLGAGAFVEGFDENRKVRFQFVNRLKIYPITMEQDKITECAFVNVSSTTTTIQIHHKDSEGYYLITNLFYEKQQNDTSESIGLLNSERSSVTPTGDKNPWFQLLKPNVANNLDINSPMGISVFANALDVLQGVDLAYDGFCEEMRLGKARIFVNKKLTQYDADGERVIFDVDETGFYYLGGGENEDKQPVTFYNPALRTDSYFTGINNALNLLSSKVGFGENHYRFDKGGIATATQVVSENSEMFRTLKKHEIILNDVLIDAVKALMYISNNFTDDGYNFDLNENLEIKFDDSIIEDKETQKMADRQDVNLGVMSKAEYRAKWYNEDEETAKQKLAEIEEANRSQSLNFFSEE